MCNLQPIALGWWGLDTNYEEKPKSDFKPTLDWVESLDEGLNNSNTSCNKIGSKQHNTVSIISIHFTCNIWYDNIMNMRFPYGIELSPDVPTEAT